MQNPYQDARPIEGSYPGHYRQVVAHACEELGCSEQEFETRKSLFLFMAKDALMRRGLRLRLDHKVAVTSPFPLLLLRGVPYAGYFNSLADAQSSSAPILYVPCGPADLARKDFHVEAYFYHVGGISRPVFREKLARDFANMWIAGTFVRHDSSWEEHLRVRGDGAEPFEHAFHFTLPYEG